MQAQVKKESSVGEGFFRVWAIPSQGLAHVSPRMAPSIAVFLKKIVYYIDIKCTILYNTGMTIPSLRTPASVCDDHPFFLFLLDDDKQSWHPERLTLFLSTLRNSKMESRVQEDEVLRACAFLDGLSVDHPLWPQLFSHAYRRYRGPSDEFRKWVASYIARPECEEALTKGLTDVLGRKPTVDMRMYAVADSYALSPALAEQQLQGGAFSRLSSKSFVKSYTLPAKDFSVLWNLAQWWRSTQPGELPDAFASILFLEYALIFGEGASGERANFHAALTALDSLSGEVPTESFLLLMDRRFTASSSMLRNQWQRLVRRGASPAALSFVRATFFHCVARSVSDPLKVAFSDYGYLLAELHRQVSLTEEEKSLHVAYVEALLTDIPARRHPEMMSLLQKTKTVAPTHYENWVWRLLENFSPGISVAAPADQVKRLTGTFTLFSGPTSYEHVDWTPFLNVDALAQHFLSVISEKMQSWMVVLKHVGEEKDAPRVFVAAAPEPVGQANRYRLEYDPQKIAELMANAFINPLLAKALMHEDLQPRLVSTFMTMLALYPSTQWKEQLYDGMFPNLEAFPIGWLNAMYPEHRLAWMHLSEKLLQNESPDTLREQVLQSMSQVLYARPYSVAEVGQFCELLDMTIYDYFSSLKPSFDIPLEDTVSLFSFE